ncbi:adhesion G protein-coupled receptor E3, partial [Biomphalaria glabrata]
ITKDVSTISDGYSYQLGVVQEVDGNLTDKVTPVLWLDLFVLATRRLDRDSFENIALDIFFGEHREEDNVFVLNNLLTNELYGYYSSINSLIWPKREKMFVNLTFYNSLYFGFQHNIILSSTLTCCFLTFQQDNFTIEWNRTNLVDNLIVTLDVGGTKINISTVSDINSMEVTEQRELHICLNVLDKYFNKSTKSSYLMKLISVALNILTYSCMCASELCLLLTLITYFRFSELRTVPGINNIFLSLSLLLAQLALIVTSNIQGPSALCTYTGIVTHFLWLWHFTWSFLCSLHMFRVFTAKIPNQLSKRDTQCVRVMKLVPLSLIGPLSIVAVSICSSYWTTGSVGYGKHSCYLDSAFLIGISVVAPVSLVALCNLTFLALTVASIHRVNTLVTFDGFKRDQFKNLFLYVKLSSVTNIYWIVTIVGEAVDNDAM